MVMIGIEFVVNNMELNDDLICRASGVYCSHWQAIIRYGNDDRNWGQAR